MMEFRYQLAKRGKIECPQCHQRRFVPYIDTESGQMLAPYVGRCDREENCRYHYTPKMYFKDNGMTMPATHYTATPTQRVTPPPSYIDENVVSQTLRNYEQNVFVKWLSNEFGATRAAAALELYHVGTTKDGSTIFWQIDQSGRTHTGKIMLYNSNGHRVKDDNGARVNWAHKALNLHDFTLEQCLFGEHLLKDDKRPVAVVESEKTAIIGSLCFDDYIWTATGGCNGLTPQRCKALHGRNVWLFPDGTKFDEWSEKSKALNGICESVSISNAVTTFATLEELQDDCDIADIFLKFHHAQSATATRTTDFFDLRAYRPQTANVYAPWDDRLDEITEPVNALTKRILEFIDDCSATEWSILSNVEPENYALAVAVCCEFVLLHPDRLEMSNDYCRLVKFA
jgi:hypothetical protein